MDAKTARTDHTCGLGLAYCRSPICRSVPEPIIGSNTKSRLLKKGERLTITENGCHRIWVLLSGFAAICNYLPDGRRQLLELELPGDVICGLSSDDGSEMSLRALTDCRICEVSLESLQGGLSNHPEVMADLFWHLHQRLQQSLMQQVVLGRLDRTERVCRFLLDMADRIGIQGPDGLSIDLPMTRDDMADYLGLNTDTVSRVLTQLKKSRLIAIQARTHIIIRDKKALQSKAMLSDYEERQPRIAMPQPKSFTHMTIKDVINGR